MRRSFHLFIVICSLCLDQIIGQEVPADLQALLNQTLESQISSRNAQSLSASIQFGDGSNWAYANGISSINPTVHVTDQHCYLIGSVTKTITAACILQLAQEGRLSLDDPLSKWLSPIPHIDSMITIRQLLQHTSGLFDVLYHPNFQNILSSQPGKVWTAEELVKTFILQPQFQPGASWAYCNTNYFLLGMIIQKITQRPFYTEYRKRFFEPLQLTSFGIPAFETLANEVAHIWMDLNGDQILEDGHNFYFNYKALNSVAGAAGGYYSTAADLSKWMQHYFTGNILDEEMIAEMKKTVNAIGSQGGKYGLGIMKNTILGHEAWGHGGDLAYHASSWYFPSKNISISVVTNDESINSWVLLDVVKELLRTCEQFMSASTDFSGPSDIHIFPNPTNGAFSVEFLNGLETNDMKYTVLDSQGKSIAVQMEVIDKLVTINLTNRPSSGVYYLKWIHKSGRHHYQPIIVVN